MYSSETRALNAMREFMNGTAPLCDCWHVRNKLKAVDAELELAIKTTEGDEQAEARRLRFRWQKILNQFLACDRHIALQMAEELVLR